MKKISIIILLLFFGCFNNIVAQSKTGERLVGLLAKRQAVTNPKNTIFQIISIVFLQKWENDQTDIYSHKSL